MSSMEQGETIDGFWSQRFDRIRKEILMALGANYRGDVALAIMPFDSPRYRYCKEVTLTELPSTSPSKKLILNADGNGQLETIAEEQRAVSLPKLQEKIRSLNDNWADLYEPSTLVATLVKNTPDKETRKVICAHAEALKERFRSRAQEALEHDYSFFSVPGKLGTLSENAKELLASESLTRQQAYDALTNVLFPSESISAPSKTSFSQRRSKFCFEQHTSYRHQLALAYWLDAVAFPFSHIASWPVASYQPSAWLMVVGDINQEEQDSWNLKLKEELVPLIEKWELAVETELYAFRLSEFQRRMNLAFEMADKNRVRKEIEICSRYLFYNERLIYFKRQNGAWVPDEGDETGFNTGEPVASLFPIPNDSGPLGLSELAKGHVLAPVMKLGDWHRIDVSEMRENYLLATTYHQLLNESRLLHAVMERNQLASAGQLVRFLLQGDSKEQIDARDGFITGLREVIRVHERLAMDRPLGSERLARLCQRLKMEFQDLETHDFFEPKKDFILLPEAPATIAEILQNPEIGDLIVKLREDLHEGRRNGLVQHLLLRPLSPLWLSENAEICRNQPPIALSGALLKSWSHGAIWLPHLYLLKGRCGHYGNTHEERMFLANEWNKANNSGAHILGDKDFRYRVIPKGAKYSPDHLLAIMMAFSNFCTALNIKDMFHSVNEDDGVLTVTLKFEQRLGGDLSKLEAAIKTPPDDFTVGSNHKPAGNLSRSARLIEMIFPLSQRNVDTAMSTITLSTHDGAVEAIA